MSTTTFPSAALTWKQADADVHVATRDGEYAGFVEFNGSAHLVHDAHGAEVGAFDDLPAARYALENSTHAVQRAPRFFGRRRVRRARP